MLGSLRGQKAGEVSKNADVRYGAALGVVRFVGKNGKLIGRIDVGMDAGSLRQVCPNSGWRSP